jgi:hypothetical protein
MKDLTKNRVTKRSVTKRSITKSSLTKSSLKKRSLKKSPRKWSDKYKKNINCKDPKGFSQKQYCLYGRKK